ncbi:channel protein TolC [Psychromonas sp. B3M02]|uniref:TolC family outer membrane protein n=1 Tax=Psychromonas sp. B3M02 TaxID=2267226 RepID=UPI000DEB4091|nr:TolC family outer membrane protein [Psychromonas sp. B3M02]RBW42475.1 channel protein TolC [Psychromonas sp. B3M02]
MKSLQNGMTKKAVLVAFSSLALLPFQAQSQSLEQAVAHTLDTNPEIHASFTQFKVKEKQVEQAEADFYPTLEATGGIGYEYTDSPTTRRYTDSLDNTEELTRRELGLSLTQNVFNGFKSTSEVDRTSYATSAEQWRLHSIAEDISLDVVNVYIDLIEAEKLVALSEKNLQSHIDIYDQIKERTESGFSSKADLSQISGRLAQAESNLIAAKNNYLDSKTMFYSVVDQRPENLVIPFPDSSMLPKTQAEGLALALKNHPSIWASTNDIQSANAQYKSAKSTFYPELNLEIEANFNDNIDGVDGYNGTNDVGGNNDDVVAMLRFRYNLYNGGRDKAYAKETAYKINEAKALNMKAHREVKEGFLLSWDAYELLNKQKQYIKMHVIAAKDSQEDYKEQFKIGQRSLLDLLDTENELFQARNDFLEAEFDEITAQYRILHAMGILLDSLRVTRPEAWKGEQEFDGGVYNEKD